MNCGSYPLRTKSEQPGDLTSQVRISKGAPQADGLREVEDKAALDRARSMASVRLGSLRSCQDFAHGESHHVVVGLTTARQQGVFVQLVTRDASAPENATISVHAGAGVDDAYAEARRRGYEIVHPLTDEPWGLRRFFVRAPDGTVINVTSHSEEE